MKYTATIQIPLLEVVDVPFDTVRFERLYLDDKRDAKLGQDFANFLLVNCPHQFLRALQRQLAIGSDISDG